MKILDSTTIIAIFSEINCPDLINKILQLKHDLIIPSHVANEELLDKGTFESVQKFVATKQIRISELNTRTEVEDFQKSHPGLGLGECDTMLTYQKLNDGTENVYCILDDGLARSKAESLSIEFTGLLGLLKIMSERDIMTKDDANDVVEMLRQSNFRIPKDFVI